MGRNLSAIETLDVKQLSQLGIHDLADLNDQVAKLVSHTKELKEKLEDALNLRFSETVQNKLHDENKNTGTEKFVREWGKSYLIRFLKFFQFFLENVVIKHIELVGIYEFIAFYNIQFWKYKVL